MKKIKILTVFGTRPEVIKLASFIKAVASDQMCTNITCTTTQQKELQKDLLDLFNIQVDYDLNIMKKGQDLFHITEKILHHLKTVLATEKPDFTVVQGDTTTAFAAALSSFYQQIPVVHLEAGLRTNDIYSPYPEEANRALIARITSLHMAPTLQAVTNLKQEGVDCNVYHVGNTIVDAVDWILNNSSDNRKVQNLIKQATKKILITIHRRENFGKNLHVICNTISDLAQKYPNYTFVWPVHPNPNIQQFVYNNLQNLPNLKLLEPLPYPDLIHILNNCKLILSDSGGIQEEAYILKKPIIILRDRTERPEVVTSGYGVLTEINKIKIERLFNRLVKNSCVAKRPAAATKIYGKPGVATRILSIIKKQFNHA